MSIELLSEVLTNGDVPKLNDSHWSPPERRYLGIIHGNGHRPSPLEHAVLLRQCLRHQNELHGGSSYLRIPEKMAPSSDILASTGLSLIPQANNSVAISAKPWKPNWFEKTEVPPFAAAMHEVRRRKVLPFLGDPFLALMNYERYLSPGQQSAIRATVSAPPGSTLFVCLPTGSGKSACAQLLGLSEASNRGRVTIVVVPTDALNVDQERQIIDFLGYDCAYRGASSEATKQEICRRVYSGEQRLLFATPEAIVGRLRSPLLAAAESGDLGALVVDEAHIIDAWGDAFRPEFQELPGLRRELLRRCPADRKLVTVLLSATMTPSCVRLLEQLFPPWGDAPLGRVFSLGLRPEPSYWFAQCDSQQQRIDRLLEALAHAPRPAIVYSSLKSEKQNEHGLVWGTKQYMLALKQAGYRRIAAFTGDTTPSNRQKVIKAWAADSLDLVIATSAFGLGVDKQNVRAVFHACLPESIDRFYQEVGRGGRDGLASVSVVLHTSADIPVASRLSGQKNITVKKGYPRWKAMYRSRDRDQALGHRRYRINIDTVPDYRAVGTPARKRNRQWNIRTLLLMARAGLIEFDAEQPPTLPPLPGREASVDEQNQILAERARIFEEFAGKRIVVVKHDQHLDQEVWKTVVEAARTSGAVERTICRDTIRGKSKVYQQLTKTYEDPERGIFVTLASGGEPGLREEKRVFCEPPRVDALVWPERTKVGPQLESLLNGRRLLIAEFPNKPRELQKIIRWLIRQNVINLHYDVSEDLHATVRSTISQDTTSPLFVDRGITRFTHGYPSRLVIQPFPTALILGSDETVFENWEWVNRLPEEKERFPVVVLVPEGTRDPERADRELISVQGRSDRAVIRSQSWKGLAT